MYNNRLAFIQSFLMEIIFSIVKLWFAEIGRKKLWNKWNQQQHLNTSQKHLSILKSAGNQNNPLTFLYVNKKKQHQQNEATQTGARTGLGVGLFGGSGAVRYVSAHGARGTGQCSACSSPTSTSFNLFFEITSTRRDAGTWLSWEYQVLFI